MEGIRNQRKRWSRKNR